MINTTKKIKVKFLRPMYPYKTGQIGEIKENLANRFEEKGFLEIIKEETKKETKKEIKKTTKKEVKKEQNKSMANRKAKKTK